jgi:hypothetical protein
MKNVQPAVLVVNVLLLVLAGTIVIASLQYNFRQRIVPLVIGIPTLVMLIAILLSDFSPRLNQILAMASLRSLQDTPNEDLTASWARIFVIAGWLVALSIALFVFGFYVVVPLFLLAFFLLEAKIPAVIAVLSSLVISAVLYVLFPYTLGIEIWPGIMPKVMHGVFGGGRIPVL